MKHPLHRWLISAGMILALTPAYAGDIAQYYRTRYEIGEIDTYVVLDGWTAQDVTNIDPKEFAHDVKVRMWQITNSETKRLNGRAPNILIHLPFSWWDTAPEIRRALDHLKIEYERAHETAKFEFAPELMTQKPDGIYRHVESILNHGWSFAAVETNPMAIFYEQFIGGKDALKAGAQLLVAAHVLSERNLFSMNLHGGYGVENSPDEWRVEHLVEFVAENRDMVDVRRGQVNYHFHHGDVSEPISLRLFDHPELKSWPRERISEMLANTSDQLPFDIEGDMSPLAQTRRVVSAEIAKFFRSHNADLVARMSTPETDVWNAFQSDVRLVQQCVNCLNLQWEALQDAYKRLLKPMERILDPADFKRWGRNGRVK